VAMLGRLMPVEGALNNDKSERIVWLALRRAKRVSQAGRLQWLGHWRGC